VTVGIHVAVDLRCAQKVNADRIYTFNVKDFGSPALARLADKIAAP
jgi:hypothetical protein